MTIRLQRLAAAVSAAVSSTMSACATMSVPAAMSICATLTALAATSLSAPASAVQLMTPATPQNPGTIASLTAMLTAQNAAQGLDANHGVAFVRQHPGAQGTQVSRFDHTYKGVRIFGSDAVVVTDSSGKALSVTASDRGQNLGRGAANRLGPSTADFDAQ